MKTVLTACFLALLLAGCDSVEEENGAEVAEARARWEALALDTYRIVQARTCYCPGPPAVRLVVQDGWVTAAYGIESGDTPGVEQPGAYLTIEQVFDRLEEYERRDLARFQVVFHPEYGYPTDINIDPNAGMADDEFVMRLSDLEPLAD